MMRQIISYFFAFIILLFTQILAKADVRIVSLAPNITETLFALDLGKQIVGVTKQCDFPQAANSIKKVGDYGKPNFEILLTLKPTHIVVTEGVNPQLLAPFKNKNINVILFKTSSFEELKSSINEIGKTFQHEKQAQHLIEKINSAQKKILSASKIEKSYLGIISTTPTFSFSKNTFLADILRLANYKNLLQNPVPKYPQLSKEYLISSHPDILFVTQGILSELNEKENSDTWKNKLFNKLGIDQKKSLPKVILLPKDIFERAGPRVVDAIEFLQKIRESK